MAAWDVAFLARPECRHYRPPCVTASPMCRSEPPCVTPSEARTLRRSTPTPWMRHRQPEPGFRLKAGMTSRSGGPCCAQHGDSDLGAGSFFRSLYAIARRPGERYPPLPPRGADAHARSIFRQPHAPGMPRGTEYCSQRERWGCRLYRRADASRIARADCNIHDGSRSRADGCFSAVSGMPPLRTAAGRLNDEGYRVAFMVLEPAELLLVPGRRCCCAS